MLMRCSPLLLLSMLQLVVLSRIVADDIYTKPYTRSATRQPASQFNTALRDSAPGHERTSSSDVKLHGLLKPISLSYLKANLANVASPLDFVKLFARADTQDYNFHNFIPIAIQAASHSRSSLPRIKQPFYADDEAEDFSGAGENGGGNDIVTDDFTPFETFVETTQSSVTDDDIDIDYDYIDEFPQVVPSLGDYEAFEAALHHIDEMKTCSKSKCQHPTPYVLNVRDKYDSNRVFLPECVVLHRCMNYSGCCGSLDHECVAKTTDTVVKSFLVANWLWLHQDEVMFDPTMSVTLSFVNHTGCECREKTKWPKCKKRCPNHFRLSQEGPKCICGCFPIKGHDPWPCESVHDGLLSLPSPELECIKSGQCYKPKCKEGEFDDFIGYCPLSKEYALPAFMFENATDRYHYRVHLYNYDFTTPHWRNVSVTKGSLISPTPSSENDALISNNNDTLGDIEI